MLLTFDDGFANNASVALPILESFNAPAIYFVTTQHVLEPGHWLPATRRQIELHGGKASSIDKAICADLFDGMNPRQLAACAKHRLITIGAHTHGHPFLTRCNDHDMHRELTESKDILERVTNQPVTLFAYPTGDYDLRVAQAVADAGYRAAFAVRTRQLGKPSYEIPRIGLYQDDAYYLSLKCSPLANRPLVARLEDG